MKQIRGGRKPEGICMVCGSCAAGFPDAQNRHDPLCMEQPGRMHQVHVSGSVPGSAFALLCSAPLRHLALCASSDVSLGQTSVDVMD